MSEDAVPYGRQALEACPACGSHRICCIVNIPERLDFCMHCLRTWEPVRPGDAWMIDGELMPFETPCDNCAFRGGSQERLNAESWANLQSTLAQGGRFYCHKGVPLLEGAKGFDFPRQSATVDIAGKCHPYQRYDTERMRLCRGYLNAHIAPLLKEHPYDATP